MCQVSDWLEKLVLDVRVQAFRPGLAQAEVVRRLRSGEALEALFPELGGSLHGMTTTYLLWEIQAVSWSRHRKNDLLSKHMRFLSLLPGLPGKSVSIHHLVLGRTEAGMGWKYLMPFALRVKGGHKK